MWLYRELAVLLVGVYSVLGQAKPDGDCLSNKDCPPNRLCAEFKCINPCLLNLCGDASSCMVSNHIPVCACKGSFSGPLNGASPNKGKKKFQLSKEKLTWMQALVQCGSQGMRLATIESQDEQDRLVNQIKQLDKTEYKIANFHSKWYWWIGGADLHKRGEFMWISSYKPIVYNKFGGGQPDNKIYGNGERERCMLIVEEWNFGWNDYMCDHNEYFICEYYE